MMYQHQFGFQHAIEGERIGEEWQHVVSDQAKLLERILYQIFTTVSDIQKSGVPLEQQRNRLAPVFDEASRLLTSRAQHHASLESKIAKFRGSFGPSRPIPPGADNRLRIMEQVNATLHANLALARQRVTILREANL